MAEQVTTNKRRSPFARLGELFDASALGLVTLLLLGASFFATWRGMRDFIVSREIAEGAASQGLVLLIVATLSLAMYVALREMIAPYYVQGWWSAIWKRIVAGILYAVLALWSVGFGYGFWWSLVAGQSATEAGLQRTVASVQQETSDIRARLAAAGSVMTSAQALSDLKAEQEAVRGGTCGVNSPAGAGPLARARGETQAQIAALGNSVQTDWQAPLSARLAGLEAELEGALETSAGLTGDGRKRRFEALGRDTETAAREIGADATARGRTLAVQLRAKADQLALAPEGGRVTYCYDPDLAASLNAAADELDQTYTIEVTPFTFAEGPDGVARAIEDLVNRAGGVAGRLTGLGSGVKSMALAGRDLIALLAAIGVDLGLFVFALLRGSGGRVRFEGADPQAKEAEPIAVPSEKLPALETDIETPAQTAIETVVAKSLPAPEEDDLPEGVIDAEHEPVSAAPMIDTFVPDSQIEPREQIGDLLKRVQTLMAGIDAATLAVERTPLQNKMSDTLRELRKLGYLETGSSDKVYKDSLHHIVGLEHSDQEDGYILRIVRPGFVDAEGRLKEKALVIVSLGPESQ